MKSYRELSEMLAQDAERVCEYLLPNGKVKNGDYYVGDVDGSEGKSLKVDLKGAHRGKWVDFNPGTTGDLLDLWAANRRLTTAEAYREVCDWLGVESPKMQQPKKIYAKPSKPIENPKQDTVIEYLTEWRGLSLDVIKRYGVIGHNDTIIFNYFRDGELVNRKALPIKRDSRGKKLPARFEKGCELCLYGWDAIGSQGRSIAICEGEIDAMSLAMYGIDALSVPNGAAGTTWIESDYDRLSKYDKIYLCFDNDEAGQAGSLKHAKRLGLDKCHNVILPKNDANDCLVAKIGAEEIQACFESATSFDPDQLQSPIAYQAQVMNLLFPADGQNLGYDSPWRWFNEKIFFDQSGLSVWTGINGHGKTQFLNNLSCYWMSKGAKVCIASLELEPAETMQNLIAPLSCVNTIPRFGDVITKEYAQACIEWMNDGRLWFFDEFGGANAKDLIEVMQYAHRKYGIDVFVIDSLSLINIDDDDYNSQANFVRELVRFKKLNNCHVHLVVHPRKGADENTTPGKFDFKGSGTITNLADNCFSVMRNKAKELATDMLEKGCEMTEEQQKKLDEPDAFVWCMKQRKGGHEGRFGFWLNMRAKRYLSSESAKPTRYVHYSCK